MRLSTAVILAGVLALAGGLSPAVKSNDTKHATQPRVISIVAHRFAFEPREVTLKKGETVTLQLKTEDVQHGFYIRGMKVDEEILPDKPTEFTITPEKAGTFQTICDHFCGTGHKGMQMTIVVQE